VEDGNFSQFFIHSSYILNRILRKGVPGFRGITLGRINGVWRSFSPLNVSSLIQYVQLYRCVCNQCVSVTWALNLNTWWSNIMLNIHIKYALFLNSHNYLPHKCNIGFIISFPRWSVCIFVCFLNSRAARRLQGRTRTRLRGPRQPEPRLDLLRTPHTHTHCSLNCITSGCFPHQDGIFGV